MKEINVKEMVWLTKFSDASDLELDVKEGLDLEKYWWGGLTERRIGWTEIHRKWESLPTLGWAEGWRRQDSHCLVEGMKLAFKIAQINKSRKSDI